MEIEAIGKPPEAQDQLQNTSAVDQTEFVRLFIAQLQAQDPLEPQDNAQFLAQLAQFSQIEQTRQNGQQLESLNFINSINQGTGLLGKSVNVSTSVGSIAGKVKDVTITESGPRLVVERFESDDGENFLTDVRLSQITLITDEED